MASIEIARVDDRSTHAVGLEGDPRGENHLTRNALICGAGFPPVVVDGNWEGARRVPPASRGSCYLSLFLEGVKEHLFQLGHCAGVLGVVGQVLLFLGIGVVVVELHTTAAAVPLGVTPAFRAQ